MKHCLVTYFSTEITIFIFTVGKASTKVPLGTGTKLHTVVGGIDSNVVSTQPRL